MVVIRTHFPFSPYSRVRSAQGMSAVALALFCPWLYAYSPSSPPPGAPRPTSASPRPARSGHFLSLFSSKIDHMRPSSGLAPSPRGGGASSKKVKIMSKEMQKHLERASVGGADVARGARGGDEDGGRTAAANEAQMSTRARVSRPRRSAATPQTHGV